MPEGDTIHQLAGVLEGELVGRRIQDARIEHQGSRTLADAEVDDVFAVGKHLFVSTGRWALRTHMGMHGSWHRYRPGERWRKPRWSASCVLAFGDRDYVCFAASEVELVDLEGDRHRAFLRRLGPDLLAQGVNPAEAVGRARERLDPDAPLVDVLLDQRVAAGIGNVYKSELLFLEGLAPTTELRAVSDGQLEAIYARAAGALVRNVGPGPRRLRAPRPAEGGSPALDEDPGLWVYGRSGEPCLLCGSSIERARLGRHRRGTWWCPGCQPSSLSENG